MRFAADDSNVLIEFWEWMTADAENGRPPWEIAILILMVIVGAVLLRWGLLVAIRKAVAKIVSGAKHRVGVSVTSELTESPLIQERLIQRTRTIGSLLSNLATVAAFALAALVVLSLLGVNLMAIVTGFGLVAAALAVGAQNLVKDILSGLFIVAEDQYGVGDRVDLSYASGTVEAVGLRVTQVRDAEGTLWFVRNGEILRVGNQSQGWSRAVVELTAPLEVDYPALEQLLMEAAESLTEEIEWVRKLHGRPEVWGIDAINANQVVVKLGIQTRSNKHDEVARELRRRIQARLRETHLLEAGPSEIKIVGGAADDA